MSIFKTKMTLVVSSDFKMKFFELKCGEGEPCPECSSELTYAEDGMYICMNCYYVCE